MKELYDLLVEIFGAGRVSFGAPELKGYAVSKCFASGIAPSAEVFPETPEQVLQLIKLANEKELPLIPVSSTGKHRHGGTVPAVPEAVMVNLSRMKKITSIHPVFRMAVIEPGLTYGELIDALRGHNLTISMPLAPRAEKSVIASLLEVEPRLNPNTQWNVPDPLRCTDTIWGEGRRMLTGDASMGPPSIEEQQKNDNWQINSGGPDMVDYIRLLTGAQGSLGIVVNASVRCAQIPDLEKHFVVASDDLAKNVDFMYAAEHLRFGDCLFTLSGGALAMLMGSGADEIARLRAALPKWITVVTAQSRRYAPELRVIAHEKGLSDAAAKLGLVLGDSVGPLSAKDVHDRAFSPCAPGCYWKDTLRGASADIFFETTMDKTPGFVELFEARAAELGYDISDCGVYIQPQHQGVNCHCEFIIPYDAGCRESADAAGRFYDACSRALCAAGAYFYRPYGAWAPMQLGKDAMSAITLAKIKNIFDPRGILNPEKLSIH